MQKQNLKKDNNLKKQKISDEKVREANEKKIQKIKKQKIKANKAKIKALEKAKIKQRKTREKLNKDNEKRREKELKFQAKKRKQEIKRIEKIQKQRREQKIEKNVSNKNIKKIRRRNKLIRRVFALGFLIAAIILFLLSPVFNIKDVEVFGNEKVSSDTIISLLQINNTNLFKLSYKEIGKKIKQNSYIKSVKVNKVLPSKLKITITERKPSYQLEFGSSFVLIDEDGYILEILKEQRDGIVKLNGYQTSEEMIIEGNRLCQADIDRLDDAYKIINIAENYDLSNKITTITFEKNNEYSIYIEADKKTIHIGNTDDLETKLLYTKEILSRTSGEEGEIFVNMNLNEKNPYFRSKT